MNTRLLNNQNWLELAKQSGFKASVLTARLKVSRWALHRHTKKLFGQSPQDWLNEQRLILAVEKLKDCDSIKWLAGELGYKSESHFCHQFKRRYGLSPTEYLTGHKRQVAENGNYSVFLGRLQKTNLIPPAAKIFQKCYCQTINATHRQRFFLPRRQTNAKMDKMSMMQNTDAVDWECPATDPATPECAMNFCSAFSRPTTVVITRRQRRLLHL